MYSLAIAISKPITMYPNGIWYVWLEKEEEKSKKESELFTNSSYSGNSSCSHFDEWDLRCML